MLSNTSLKIIVDVSKMSLRVVIEFLDTLKTFLGLEVDILQTSAKI